MPTYHYHCAGCEHDFSRVLPFGTTETPSCPECGGRADKVIKPPMIHFKGTGFYKTDSSKSSSETVSKPKEAPKKPAPETKPESVTKSK